MSTKHSAKISTQKSTHLENVAHCVLYIPLQITDYSLNIATPYDDGYLK